MITAAEARQLAHTDNQYMQSVFRAIRSAADQGCRSAEFDYDVRLNESELRRLGFSIQYEHSDYDNSLVKVAW